MSAIDKLNEVLNKAVGVVEKICVEKRDLEAENKKLQEEIKQLRMDLLRIDAYCRANDIDIEKALNTKVADQTTEGARTAEYEPT